MKVVATRADLVSARAELPGRVAVVMTMGALHAGHAALVQEARSRADSVVATVFVNPLQFGTGEDLDRYPRTLDDDLALLEEHGADLVFTPTPDVVYPDGPPLVRISAGPLGEVLEGASRPGHFDGVLTVVAKLLHLVRPDVAVFGQKDAQQLAAISPDGARPRPAGGGRRRADRPRARRPRAVQPQRLPRPGSAPRRARAVARTADPRRHGGARGPRRRARRRDLDYLARVDSTTFARTPTATCSWSPPASAPPA